MRIIYLHQYFNTPQMAGSTRSFEIGRRLVAAGHEVEMVTSWREAAGTRDWFTSESAGMRVHWLPVPYSNRMTYGARTAAFLRFAVAAARRAAALGGDVIYASSTPLTISLPGIYAARRGGVPMVFEVRDLWPELPIAIGALRNPLSRAVARWLERFAYAHAARVVALSPGMAAGVARTGFPAARIAVVPNGCDLASLARDVERGRAFRRGLGIADEQILVGYTGTFGRINGVRYLLDVAAEFKDDRRFTFLLIGDGQESEQIRDVARRRGLLGASVLMPAKVSKEAMSTVLSALDVATSLFLPVPAMENNSANKFFDALAAGCCVAVNYGGWQAELLAQEGAGLRLAADPRAAAAQLRDYTRDRGRLQLAGCNARRLAEERFSFDHLAAQVGTVIAAAVDEWAPKRGSRARSGSF